MTIDPLSRPVSTPPQPRRLGAAPRWVGLLGAAVALATAAFWFVMIADPPTTQADTRPGAGYSAPLDLPLLNADAI